ncbi:MAG: DUF1786 domain-containing protein [Anaerolineales bacterium]|nr:DUF1786 domain-containing protein [Anaerolineales bacterium]
MKILTIDIGTGTQDIYLYDSRLDLENGFKLVVPSPTMIIHCKLKEAARRGQDVLLHGVMMGGGPSGWAAEEHIKAGLAVYATPPAARSFNDDLEKVAEMGVRLVSEDEALRLPDEVLRLELRDFDFAAIEAAFAHFGVALDDLSAVAVAVFDHGDAPPQVSDRQFRFDYLDERIRSQNRLSAFAYRAQDIPPIMTRLRAVAQSAQQDARLRDIPLVVMDTAPAAVLGATFDPQVRQRERVMIANVGNFHTLAFRLGPTGIEGVFEHHTGLLERPQLEALLIALADGSLTHADVFNHHGHGALIYHDQPLSLEGEASLVVTGPRRSLMHGSPLRPYYAVPFGDMMIAGCFGLLAAAADVLPELHEPVRRSLDRSGGSGAAPWDLSA